MMPESHVRLSAGREQMNEQMQALAFLAANSIFYGEKLPTTGNPQVDKDMRLFARPAFSPKPGKSTPTKAPGGHRAGAHGAARQPVVCERRSGEGG